MPFLDILEGISPWWWVAAAFVLGAVEIATGTYVLIWICLAALQMAVLVWIAPGLSGELQLTVFAALAVAITFAGRWIIRVYGDGGQEHATLNNRGSHLVGRTGRVLSGDGDTGAVEVDGTRWRARWIAPQEASPGTRIRVTAVQGMELLVENL